MPRNHNNQNSNARNSGNATVISGDPSSYALQTSLTTTNNIVSTNSTNITNNSNSINTINTTLTDITYTNNSGQDLTSISNNVLITGDLSASGIITFPTNSIASTAINNSSFCDLTTTQTIYGIKTFNSIPYCITAPSGNNYALTNKSYVDTSITTAINNLIGGAPATLDTLNEIALSLGNNASLSTSLLTSISLKSPIDNPNFTGLLRETNIGEAIQTGLSVATGIVNVAYNSGGIAYITNTTSSTNFTINITNLPTTLNTVYTQTCLIDATTYKTYGGTIQIGGVGYTSIYIGGSPIIVSAVLLLQTITIIFTSGTTPYNGRVIVSISPVY